MNGKLLWRTALAIFVIVISAAVVRNCREMRTDHEMQMRDHDTLKRMESQGKK